MIGSQSPVSKNDQPRKQRVTLSSPEVRKKTNYEASLSLLLDQQRRQTEAVHVLSYTASIGYVIIATIFSVLVFALPLLDIRKIAIVFIFLNTIFAFFMNYQLINASYARKHIDKTVFRSLSEEAALTQKIVFDRYAENRQSAERYLVFSSAVYFKMVEFATWTAFITIVSLFAGRV